MLPTTRKATYHHFSMALQQLEVGIHLGHSQNDRLVIAAKKVDEARVAMLISRGADCDATHDLGDTFYGPGRSV